MAAAGSVKCISFIVVTIFLSFCEQYFSRLLNCIYLQYTNRARAGGDWLKANCEGENMKRTNRDVKIRLTGDSCRSPVYFFILPLPHSPNSVFLLFCQQYFTRSMNYISRHIVNIEDWFEANCGGANKERITDDGRTSLVYFFILMLTALHLIYAVFLIFCQQYFLQNFNCISFNVSIAYWKWSLIHPLPLLAEVL